VTLYNKAIEEGDGNRRYLLLLLKHKEGDDNNKLPLLSLL
jgi:hypothetical protein